MNRRVQMLEPGRRMVAILAFLVAAGSVHAQYKWTAPDGTVTYGDKPPISEVQASRVGGSGVGNASSNANLPYALRSVADKYPVTLYTTGDCSPCDQTRAHLGKRGIPFTEKLIKTQADAQAMAKLGLSDGSFPVLTVGRQKQLGYESAAVDGLLDSAGYPRNSMLPTSYRGADASKLAANEDEAAPKKPAPAASRPAPKRERNTPVQSSAVPSAPSQDNPTGLRF